MWWHGGLKKGGKKGWSENTQSNKKPKTPTIPQNPFPPFSFFPFFFSRLFPLSLSFPPSSLLCAIAFSITTSMYYLRTARVHVLNQQYSKQTQDQLLFFVFLSCPISLFYLLFTNNLSLYEYYTAITMHNPPNNTHSFKH